MDMIATIHVTAHVKDVMQLMDCATQDVCQGGGEITARKVNCEHSLISPILIGSKLIFFFLKN